MRINKPNFWDGKIGFFSILLFPLSLIVLFLVFLKKKFSKVSNFKIPIICVGNIYIGGTGKTPTSIYIVNELNKMGKNAVIFRKHYEDQVDEHNLIRGYLGNLILSKNRVVGLREIEKSNFDTVIMDDGLQDYKIKKNISIACFNSNQLIGNGLVIPSGPLRESLNSLKNINIVIINGNRNKIFEEKILKINSNLNIFYSYYEPKNLNDFTNQKLLAIAGIGNPENFFSLIEQNNLNIQKKIIYPDHYKFSKEQFQNIIREAEEKNYKIIMTEKDFYKIKKYDFDKVNFLKVELKIVDQENFNKVLKNLYD